MESKQGNRRFGSVKYGRKQASALLMAIPPGLLLAALAACAVAFSRPGQQVQIAVVLTAVFWPLATTLFWVLLVDRDSIRGAVANPEASVETLWFGQAASDGFLFLMALLGLGSAVFAFLPSTLPPAIVLAASWAAGLAIFLVRYAWAKRG